MRHRRRKTAAWFAPAIVALAVGGCSREAPKPVGVEVSGTVRLDGQPLPAGEITFKSLGRPGGGTATIANGAYRLDSQAGVVAGRHRIEVRDPHDRLPSRYNSDSQLVQDIMPGQSRLDLELTTKP